MPRQNDPADITVGSGLASNESIETNAFIHPTGGQEGLRVHIQDPSRAHEARAINVIDTPNNFASDHVEGALEELASSGASGRSNGLVQGGTFAASVGLTFELDAPTTVLLNGTVHDEAGSQVALTPSTTQYVYIDPGSGNLVAGALPALTTEPILLWEITTDGAGITGSRDLRFFVFNIDRKNALIVRSDGANFNQRSEASFITLEAALTYLELYAGSGSDEVETHHIIVRGSHDISSTFTVPVEGVIFEGDGTGGFVDTTGGSTLFTVDVDKVKFKNLLFTANDPSSVAFDGTDPVEFLLENCEFDSDGDSWGQIVSFSNSNLPGIQRFRMVGCRADCYAGVYIEKTTDCRIEDCRFSGVGGAAGGTTCIEFGASGFATQGFDIVRGVRLAGFEVGVSVASNNFTMSDSYMSQVGTDGIVSTAPNTNILNVSVVLDATDGVSGISLSDDGAVVEGCYIENPRTTWSGEDPIGILLTASADSRISNCVIDGFLEDTVPDGAGIQADGDCPDLRIQGNLIRTTLIGIDITDTDSQRALITGNRIEEVRVAAQVGGGFSIVSDCIIKLSEVDDPTGGLNGIQFLRSNCHVDNCRIENGRRWLAGPTGEDPIGVWFSTGTSDGGRVTNSVISGFFNETDVLGHGVQVASASTKVQIRGNTISNPQIGVEIATAPEGQVFGNEIRNTAVGIQVSGSLSDDRYVISGNQIELNSSRGLTGILLDNVADSIVTGCHIQNERSSYGASDVPRGISFTTASAQCSVSDCTIENFLNTSAAPDEGAGIYMESGLANRIADCTVTEARYGIETDASTSILDVSNCQFRIVETGALFAGGGRNSLEGCYIETDASRGRNGVEVIGSYHRIAHCQVYNLSDTGFPGGFEPVGVLIGPSAQGVNLDSLQLRNWYNSVDDLGSAIRIGTAVNLTTLTNIQIDDARIGIATEVSGATISGRLTATGCTIRQVQVGMELHGTRNVVSDCIIELDSARGLNGILVGDGTTTDSAGDESGRDTSISNCHFDCPRTVWGFPIPNGVWVEAPGVKVGNCTFLTFNNTSTGGGRGVFVEGYSNASVTGCTFVGCHQGVYLDRGTTHVTVQGNTIEGENDTSTGILALGLDAAGDRTDTVNISNNLIKGCVSQGIYLQEHVRNATLAGNTVNGFIGTGTEVTAYGIRVDSSAGETGEYINVDGNTVFNSTHGIIFEGVAGSPVSRSSITNNVIHHVAVGTAPADTFAGAGALGIGLNEASNVVVSGNQLFSMGELINEDGSTFSPAAADYGAQGIYCLNTSELTIEGNNIRDTFPAGTGDGRGIGVRHRQNSGPRTSQGFTISGNVLSGTANSSIDVQVADSLSAGAQTMKGMSIEGNSILSSGAAGIRILVVTDSTLQALSISDNTIEDATNNGINLDATASGAVIEAPSITSNSIEEPGLNGIVLTAAFASASISGGLISGNSVLRAGNYGIYALGSINATLPNGVMPGLKINNNNVQDSTDDGIRVEATALGIVIGTTVNDNTVLASGGEGIHLRAASGVLAGVQAHGNTLSRPTDNGILATASGIGGAMTDMNLVGNVVNDPGASGIEFVATGPNVTNFERLTIQSCAVVNPTDKGIHVSADEEDILDVTIRDCRIDATSGSTMTYGILVVTLDPTVRQDINRITITNNVVYDPFTSSATAGIEVFARGNIIGSAVHGNEVTMAGRDLFGIRVESFYDFSTEAISVEHNLSDNKIVLDTLPTVGGTGGAGIALYGFSPAGNLGAKLADVSITNNNLLYTGKGIDVASGARVTGGDNFDQIGTIKVHGNTITDCLRQAIHIRSPNTDGNRGATLHGGVVTDNTVSYANTDDFDCGVIDIRATTPMRNWVVNENNVSYTGSAAAAGTAPAIYVFGGIGGFGFQDIDVSRNVVWDCNTGDGVRVELADAGAVRNVSADFNSLRQIEDHGVQVILTDATTAENAAMVGNKTNDTGASGVEIQTPDSTTMQNLNVSQNLVTNAGVSGVRVQCNDAGRNWSIIGNHVHDTATYGIHQVTSTGKDTTVLSTLVVSNNTAYDVTGVLTNGIFMELQRSVLRLVYANNSVSNMDIGHMFILGSSAGSEGTLNTCSFLGNVSGNVSTHNVRITGTNTVGEGGSTPLRIQAQVNSASGTGDGWSDFVTETSASTTGNTN